MTSWRVTHINQQRQRHVLHVLATSSATAQEQADHLFGPARYCACINLSHRYGA